MFDTTKTDLLELMKSVDTGKLQLPEFQRSYVWNDSDLRSLLASVLKRFPVGALLTLERGGQVKFKPRLIEGVLDTKEEAQELLLDGQQRMTSLYQSTFSKQAVATKSDKQAPIRRYYYLDIKKALSAGFDIDDAIVPVPENRQIREDFNRKTVLDISTEELELQEDMFPLNRIFDPNQWLFAWQNYWNAKGRADIIELASRLNNEILDPYKRYEMPIIRLRKENGREAICTVFEKVNVGGKKLDAFELVTAIYAGDDFDLRADWETGDAKNPGRRARMLGEKSRHEVLTDIGPADFLRACTLMHTRAERLKAEGKGKSGQDLPQVSVKREALLALPLGSYQSFSGGIEEGCRKVALFLNERRIILQRDIPYQSPILVMACVHAALGTTANTAASADKFDHWHWSMALGELYGSSAETRMANDAVELIRWIEGGEPPRSIGEAIFQESRLLSMRSRVSAAYKAVHALLMKEGCCDFISGQPVDVMSFHSNPLDIHHIFPQAWCKAKGIPPSTFNSIVNKTPLSRYSNIVIGGKAPSDYLARVEKSQGIASDRLDEILRSHLIEPSFLRTDDFIGFFDDRRGKLSALIEGAMRKKVVPLAEAPVVDQTISAEEIEENEALEDGMSEVSA
jgi:hypothetical protein